LPHHRWVRDRLANTFFVVAAALLAIGLAFVGVDQNHQWVAGLPWFIAAGCVFVAALVVLFLRRPQHPRPAQPASQFSDRDLDFDVRVIGASVYLVVTNRGAAADFQAEGVLLDGFAELAAAGWSIPWRATGAMRQTIQRGQTGWLDVAAGDGGGPQPLLGPASFAFRTLAAAPFQLHLADLRRSEDIYRVEGSVTIAVTATVAGDHSITTQKTVYLGFENAIDPQTLNLQVRARLSA
jgi:hypothetical protein